MIVTNRPVATTQLKVLLVTPLHNTHIVTPSTPMLLIMIVTNRAEVMADTTTLDSSTPHLLMDEKARP